MEQREIRKLLGFYENELTNNILPFWIAYSPDNINGGFFNCFDNSGENLVSKDKYMWSQGRFVWMWAKLASIKSDTFTRKQQSRFLELARLGCEFLKKNCFIGEDDLRCVFVTDEYGNPKYIEGCLYLDSSIYADMFVICAFAKYAEVMGDSSIYLLGKDLYKSVLNRIEKGDYHTYPYPLSAEYRSHGIPMILINTAKTLYDAALILDNDYCSELKIHMESLIEDVLTNFADENNVIHEIIKSDNSFFDELLGQHANPGHTLENCWFMSDAADILGKNKYLPKIAAIAKKAFDIGWDNAYGGLFHMCGVNGGKPCGDCKRSKNEPMLKQVIEDWDYKLWWVHSEALYTTLLLYFKTNDTDFLDYHQMVFDYIFSTFPNPDREIREWIQIRTLEGKPKKKIVALPVKDPFHISRNLILLIELLYRVLYSN